MEPGIGLVWPQLLAGDDLQTPLTPLDAAGEGGLDMSHGAHRAGRGTGGSPGPLILH